MENKLDLSSAVGRRALLKNAAFSGAGLASLGLLASATKVSAAGTATQDTVAQIVTAALVAEDLATTFYYNGLVGPVIQDPSLAGSGGGISANGTPRVTNGNTGNVIYIQAALAEEYNHANFLRGLLGKSNPSTDPYTTFYFNPSTFSSIGTFLATLDALENAFIGAYLNAIREFSTLASEAAVNPNSSTYSAAELTYFAVVAASIMGVESEHRTLGRVISGMDPANNRNYEQYDGLTSVYNGAHSAVAALTPFLTPSNGKAYTLATALSNRAWVDYPVEGMPPAMI